MIRSNPPSSSAAFSDAALDTHTHPTLTSARSSSAMGKDDHYEWKFVKAAKSSNASKGKGKGKGKASAAESTEHGSPTRSVVHERGGNASEPWIQCKNPKCAGWCPVANLREGTCCKLCKLIFTPPPGAKLKQAAKPANPAAQAVNAKGQPPSSHFDLAKHLAALIAAKDTMSPNHANLIEAAKVSLAAEAPPPNPKEQLAASQSAVQAALAAQTIASDKCDKLKKKVQQHFEYVKRFIAELSTAEEALLEAKLTFSKAVASENAISSGNVDARLVPSLATPIDLAKCSSLTDLVNALETLSPDDKQLLVSKLSPTPDGSRSPCPSQAGTLGHQPEQPTGSSVASQQTIDSSDSQGINPGPDGFDSAPLAGSEASQDADMANGDPVTKGAAKRDNSQEPPTICKKAKPTIVDSDAHEVPSLPASLGPADGDISSASNSQFPRVALNTLASSENMRDQCDILAKVVSQATGIPRP